MLQHLPKSQTLNLRYNNISDIAVLQKLQNLQSLDLRENKIEDISSLLGIIKKRVKINLEDFYEIGMISLYKNPINIPHLELHPVFFFY
ncbi:MAG: leucine-rich repeat domain-containing protein [Bacteroidota bacterium]